MFVNTGEGDETALVLNDEKLRDFWTFIRERHNVFERRFIQNLPPPWTEDPVLRVEKITNVFRELDRGTIWLKLNIMERDDLEDHDKVFWTMAYRMGIRSEVLDAFGMEPHNEAYQYGLEALADLMRAWEKQGKRIWTNAYMVGAQGKSIPKIDNLVLGTLRDYLQPRIIQITEELREAPDLKAAHRIIRKVPAFADFLAYEVVVDLMYPDGLLWRKGFTEDDWVNAGPGCQRGIKLLVEKWGVGWNYEDVIKLLRKEQDSMQKEYGLDPVRWRGQDLTLRNIEHSLCEYQKYNRVKTGGRSKRHFVACADPLPL